MDAKRFVGAGFVALITALACGGMSTKAGGSNTNWFATCTSTAECTGGLECWCGICTTACATECPASTTAATCVDPPAACADPSEKNACAVSCKEDADCRALGSGATCVGSVCARTKTTTKTDGGTVSCDALRAKAIAEFNPLLASADVSCKTTDDCVAAYDLSCGGACGSLSIVSKTGNATLTSGAASIEQSDCRQFMDQGCTISPAPCVPPPQPACVSGKCQRFTGQTTMADAGESCADRTAGFNAQIQPVVASADKKCTGDGDCKVVMLVNQCVESCTYVAASKTGARSIQDELDSIDANACSDFAKAGCTVTRLPCVAPPTATCAAGVCKVP